MGGQSRRLPVVMSTSIEVDASVTPLAPIDWIAVGKYKLAVGIEFALIAASFRAVDALLTLPAAAVPPLFFFLSLRSRVFSPLDASRPDRSAQEGLPTPAEVVRPGWTPPGVAFPFIWLTISFLRATSSLFVWQASGRQLCATPLLLLVFHLCVGDAWNTITNVERRLGTSALGVLGVLASVFAAIGAYYRTRPLAGLLLLPSAVWLSIASVLTWSIWAINTPRQPLWPRQGDGKSSRLRLPLSQLGAA
uniref:Uncharacterized protein n=1 Tax=Calcidiscus leptoporus TaxID=127549 RepID=A0A7S0P6H0_9EUKA